MVVAEVPNPQTGKPQWVVAGVDSEGKLIETFALPMETRNQPLIAMGA